MSSAHLRRAPGEASRKPRGFQVAFSRDLRGVNSPKTAAAFSTGDQPGIRAAEAGSQQEWGTTFMMPALSSETSVPAGHSGARLGHHRPGNLRGEKALESTEKAPLPKTSSKEPCGKEPRRPQCKRPFANCARRTGHSCLQVEPQALEVVEGASQIFSARPAARGKAMRTREATCEEVKRSPMLLD